MASLNKYRFEILSLLGLVFFYLATRLYNIMSLPMFTDEAIYTRWSQIARLDPAWRFISLTDGKQPMFVWVDMIFMKVISDPLLAGRLVSVLIGLGTMIGLFLLGREIFKDKKIGLIAAFVYVIYPFSLVYDRMALYDSMVAFFAVWSLYFEILLVRKLRLDIALILAMILGGGLLTKTSAFFFIYLLPFSFLFFDFNKKDRNKRILKWIALSVVSVVLAYSYYTILRLSPFFHIVNEKNGIFIYAIHDWVKHPFTFFYGNLLGELDWIYKYMTIPFFILVVFSILFDYKKYIKEKMLLAIWFLVPFLSLALFGRILYPRFILFMTMPLIVLIAFSFYYLFTKFKNKSLSLFIFLIFSFLALRLDFYILTDFKRAPIPYSDLEQYINGWPAGGGVKEMVEFLSKQAENQKIYVATEGTFGSLPTYGVEIYLGENKNIDKRGIWPLPPILPEDLAKKAKIMPVYFIFNQTQINEDSKIIKNWNLKFIAKYKKGIGNSYLSIYQVASK